MTHIVRTLGVTAAAVALATTAFGQTAPPTADKDLKEVASYRLTVETLKKVQTATRSIIEELKKDPHFQKLQAVEREIAALGKKDDLTEADQQRLEKLRADKESLENSADNVLNMGNADSLDEMEAQIQKAPLIANALQSAGMPPREYAKFMMAIIQASMVAGFKKAGMMKELPPGVNPENVKFIEEHEAELKAMQAEFEKLAKGGYRP